MNTIETIDIDYLRASRTIETVVVSKESGRKVFYLYNHEGNSFRLFESHLNFINFFQNEGESDYHFDTEREVDDFLGRVEVIS